MFQFEFDGALFALKYRAPALRLLFTLPPTYKWKTPRRLRAQSEYYAGAFAPEPPNQSRYAGESAAPMNQFEYDGA